MKPAKPNLHLALLKFSDALANYVEASHRLRQAAKRSARHASLMHAGAQRLQASLPGCRAPAR